MSTLAADTPAAPARLVVRLPGTWVQLDPSQPELTDQRIRAFVQLTMGRADELAEARRQLREALGLVVADAPERASLESTFLCHEIAPGVATPMAVSVFSPAEIHMSPAIGTRPDAVLDTFVAAMGAMGHGDEWERLACVDGEAVRRWRITETVVAEGTEDLPLRAFVADYWRTVPFSKRLVLVTFSSPLPDIPQTLIRMADAIVAGSRLVAPAFAG